MAAEHIPSIQQRPTMSETIFKFLLSELRTIRIFCQNKSCGVVVEMPVSTLASDPPHEHTKCKHCGQLFNPTKKDDYALVNFAKAVEAVKALEEIVQIEFVLPVNDP